MTPPPPDNSDPLLGLVRRHLLAEAADVDAAPLYERIRGTVRPAGTSRWRRRVLGVAAIAAAIAVAFVGGMSLAPGPVQASATVLLQEAKAVHAQPLDRCYLVETRPDPTFTEKQYPMLAQARTSRVWTRGDRFWVESTDPNHLWAWGRDDAGDFWIVLKARKVGLRFELRELPPPLAVSCEMYGMKVESLLRDVLRHFDVSREAGDDAGTAVIRATPRPGFPVPGLRGVTLTIDAETKVIRKAELSRMIMGRAAATVTFTLADSKTQDDALYTPEGHLTAPYELFSRDVQPLRRAELLRGAFPRILDGGPPPKMFGPRPKTPAKE